MSGTQSLQADSNGINLGGFNYISFSVNLRGRKCTVCCVLLRCFRSLSPCKFFSVILLESFLTTVECSAILMCFFIYSRLALFSIAAFHSVCISKIILCCHKIRLQNFQTSCRQSSKTTRVNLPDSPDRKLSKLQTITRRARAGLQQFVAVVAFHQYPNICHLPYACARVTNMRFGWA